MRIKWEIEDGYAGKRPHYVDVDDDEIAECETADEIEELIEQYVREEFENNIYYHWDHSAVECKK